MLTTLTTFRQTACHPGHKWRCAWQEYRGQPGCELAGESRRQELVTNVDKGWWNSRAWDVYIAGTQARAAAAFSPHVRPIVAAGLSMHTCCGMSHSWTRRVRTSGMCPVRFCHLHPDLWAQFKVGVRCC